MSYAFQSGNAGNLIRFQDARFGDGSNVVIRAQCALSGRRGNVLINPGSGTTPGNIVTVYSDRLSVVDFKAAGDTIDVGAG